MSEKQYFKQINRSLLAPKKGDNMKNEYIDISVDNCSNAPEELEEQIEQFIDITEKLLNTYIAKNIDYGNSFGELYEEYGLLSTVIRLSDKVKRLKTLEQQDAEVDESIDDTLEDLANYAIMTLIERQ